MAASSIAGKPPPASTPKSKPVTQTPAKQTFAAGLATVASVAPKASPRIQVRVEAEGALLQRVEAAKAANPSQATLSFWTKKTASVWKVMFAWAKHYQLTVDQVLFTVDGKELMKNETPESRGGAWDVNFASSLPSSPFFVERVFVSFTWSSCLIHLSVLGRLNSTTATYDCTEAWPCCHQSESFESRHEARTSKRDVARTKGSGNFCHA